MVVHILTYHEHDVKALTRRGGSKYHVYIRICIYTIRNVVISRCRRITFSIYLMGLQMKVKQKSETKKKKKNFYFYTDYVLENF